MYGTALDSTIQLFKILNFHTKIFIAILFALNYSDTTSYIRLATAEGLLVSDLLLETFVLLFILPVISYVNIFVMSDCCFDLNCLCSRVANLAHPNVCEEKSSSVGSVL